MFQLNWTDIFNGVVIGVSGSIMATIIMWLYGLIKARIEFRNQRLHIVKTIAKYETLFESVAQNVSTETADSNEDSSANSLDSMSTCINIFMAFHKEMQSINSGRTSQLSFDQRYSIFGKLDMDPRGITPIIMADESLLAPYRKIFASLKAIDWLRFN